MRTEGTTIPFRHPEYCVQPYAPRIRDNSLYVALGRALPPAFVYKAGEVVCMNLTTGSTDWAYPVCEEAGVTSNIALSGSRLFFTTRTSVVALECGTGLCIWKAALNVWEADLSILSRKLVVRHGSRITVIEPDTGKRLKTKGLRWLDCAVAEHSGRWFVGTTKRILELAPETLETVREYPYPGKWATGCSPVFWGNTLLSSSYSSQIRCFDLDTYALKWTATKGSANIPRQTMDARQGILFAAEAAVDDGELSAFEAISGRRLWRKKYIVEEMKDFTSSRLLCVLKVGDTYQLTAIDKGTGKKEDVLCVGAPCNTGESCFAATPDGIIAYCEQGRIRILELSDEGATC